MVRTVITVITLILCGTATAGVYSDDMARCLVSSTSSKDKSELVRWIFASAALHPDLVGIVNISDKVKDGMDQQIAAMITRLVTDSCRKQSQDALKYEGSIAFQQSFGALGQAAMQELMTDKKVSSGFTAFTKYMDKAKFEELNK